MPKFELVTHFTPCGDQPAAIEKISEGLLAGKKSQVLLGITGSGKTFTMANVIQKVQRPTLVIAHNKTLAAQLYQEFKAFFPHNAVEYFVSYYDYYQPEAYIARTDTYIEKDMAINDTIDQMRLSATRSLLQRDDVLIVASVSCIYGLGSPEYYKEMNLQITTGQPIRRDELLLHLVAMQYKRNDFDFSRATFRVRGDVIDIFPAYEENLGIRVEFFGDDVERISEINPLTGKVIKHIGEATIYPGSHHVTPEEVRYRAMETIREELKERAKSFEDEKKYIEHQRINERTLHDLEMIREIGFCKGIENYSRHFGNRVPGSAPACLINYFPRDFLLIVDESHQTIPQINAMYNGDQARKKSLVDFGFRLPSAYDNRPLKFSEFYEQINQVVYVSATPAPFEMNEANGEIIEQIIRPTGLLDPNIEIRPAEGQIDDCLHEIRLCVEQGERVLLTTLTKKLAEDLTQYLVELGVKAKYLHSDIETLERVQIIRDLRTGIFDVLVGINLLREGLDIPEVSLIVILDADKEGFLRSETALIQTCGRAARNVKGHVIMYADKMTKAILKALEVTEKRRAIQEAYNAKHGITPTTVRREIIELIEGPLEEAEKTEKMTSKNFMEVSYTHGQKHKPLIAAEKPSEYYTEEEVTKKVQFYEKEMKLAAKEMRFEDAAKARDLMKKWMKVVME